MEIHFKPELEDKLNQIASQSGRQPDQIVEELVETYVDHDQWFRQEVEKGLAQLDRGEFVEHDKVMERIERIFRTS
jgi:predicted transcriptional regulator